MDREVFVHVDLQGTPHVVGACGRACVRTAIMRRLNTTRAGSRTGNASRSNRP